MANAAALARDGCWDVLEATRVELEYWDPTGTWQGSFRREHPNDDPRVLALWRGWHDAWARYLAKDRARPRAAVRAFELPAAFAWARRLDDPAVRITVAGHGAISDHDATILAVLDEIVECWPFDSIAVVSSRHGYVQVMDRKDQPTTYAEAVDPEGQDHGVLSPSQRRALAEIGWSDPKVELVPYEQPGYANEWKGRNFAREWQRASDLGETAAMLAATLAAYGLDETDDLDVDMFRAAT